MPEANWTTGKVTAKIPKDTLAVITVTSDAAYAQSVTVSGGGLKAVAFNGRGTGNLPMAMKDGMEYLKVEPEGADRNLDFSFSYEEELGSNVWQQPKVKGQMSVNHHGVRMIYIGTEDSTDESFADTNLTICLFPKKTPKKA